MVSDVTHIAQEQRLGRVMREEAVLVDCLYVSMGCLYVLMGVNRLFTLAVRIIYICCLEVCLEVFRGVRGV